MTETPVVRADGVTKTFGDTSSLTDADLSVSAGETVLLLGPNGSGKTVLLSCLAGGLSPTQGEVSVFGSDPDEAAGMFSFMLQDGVALSGLTGRETIEFYDDLYPDTRDWRPLADTLGIAADLDNQVKDYSGGMVRKLELLVTLLADVPLYLLDEPTAELDMQTVDTVHSMLQAERDEDKTIVFASHRPADVQLADRIAVVTDGNIVATGDPETLMADVPRVVNVDGVETTKLADTVQDGRFFERQHSQRGFLAPGADPDHVEDAGGTIEDPTVGDLFNYYVSIHGTETGTERGATVQN